jgi:hypothetical protein
MCLHYLGDARTVDVILKVWWDLFTFLMIFAVTLVNFLLTDFQNCLFMNIWKHPAPLANAKTKNTCDIHFFSILFLLHYTAPSCLFTSKLHHPVGFFERISKNKREANFRFNLPLYVLVSFVLDFYDGNWSKFFWVWPRWKCLLIIHEKNILIVVLLRSQGSWGSFKWKDICWMTRFEWWIRGNDLR